MVLGGHQTLNLIGKEADAHRLTFKHSGRQTSIGRGCE